MAEVAYFDSNLWIACLADVRNPYDAAFLPQGAFGITSNGFPRYQLDAVISRLLLGGY